MSSLVLLVELQMNPGQRDAFLARAGRHRSKVLDNEPGCQGFEVLVPAEDEDTVFLYEVYADQGALDAHLQTPYMQEYLADTGPMIAERKRTLCRLAGD
ncbi:MAG: putative quinol monooxygenase [Kiloniellales bacterium]